MISCTSAEYCRAYGWQRDGGMAEFMIAEERISSICPARSAILTAP
jgi:D-arabinose 1-dehydrogenase-like Zn-dependent alcohol dehydrogenase